MMDPNKPILHQSDKGSIFVHKSINANPISTQDANFKLPESHLFTVQLHSQIRKALANTGNLNTTLEMDSMPPTYHLPSAYRDSPQLLHNPSSPAAAWTTSTFTTSNTPTTQTSLEKIRSEMAYAQQLLNQIQTTIHNVNQTLNSMDPNSSPFTNGTFSPIHDQPMFSEALVDFDDGEFIQDYDEVLVPGVPDGHGGVLDWSQAARSDFLNPNETLSVGEDGKVFGSTVTEAGTNSTSPEIISTPPMKKRKMEDNREIFEDFLEDSVEDEAVPVIESIKRATSGLFRTVHDRFLGGERNGEEEEEESEGSDKELKGDIEMELDRNLYGDENESKEVVEEREKARKIRCADGSLRGQYEECP